MKELLKLMLQNYPLRDKAGADGADGGGADKSAADQIAALQAQIADLQSKLNPPDTPNNPAPKKDVLSNVADQIKAEKEAEAQAKALEKAILFNLGAKGFVEDKKLFLSERAPRIVEDVTLFFGA